VTRSDIKIEILLTRDVLCFSLSGEGPKGKLHALPTRSHLSKCVRFALWVAFQEITGWMAKRENQPQVAKGT
jgi:hypothetical protein